MFNVSLNIYALINMDKDNQDIKKKYTNKDLYFKNLSINRHVGGLTAPQLQTQQSYIDDQVRILKDQNKSLYPNVRYGDDRQQLPTSEYNIQQELKTKNTPYTQNQKQNQSPKVDVYLRKDQDRYDPYVGYLYNNGLLSDTNQRRRLITQYVDINSAFRTTQTTVTTDLQYMLGPNPLQFTNGSNVVHINDPNSTFQVNDPFTITGVFSRLSNLRTIRGTDANGNPLPTFQILPGYNFMKIWYTHNIPLTYTGSIIEIIISGIQGSGVTSTFLGNIPVNTINTMQQVYLTLTNANIISDVPNADNVANVISMTGDPNYFGPSPDFLFILLPLILLPTATYVLGDYNFRIVFTTIQGIPLNRFNTSNQLNPTSLQQFQTITSVDATGYSITLPDPAITDVDPTTGQSSTTIFAGGNFIMIGVVSGINVGYPDPSSYKITLPLTYHNVVSIRLVSTEIPNSNKTIRDFPVAGANNNLYWNDLDDGDTLYQISVPAGNYTPQDLIAELNTLFAQTPRINAELSQAMRNALGITYTSTHFMQTMINLNTSVVTFNPFKEFIVQQPIINIEPPVIPFNPNVDYQLTILQNNHGITAVGTVVLIQGAIDDSGIPASVINRELVVSDIIDLNTYKVMLPRFNPITNTANTGGGVNVFIYVPDVARFRFDQPNTLGTVLGFRNPGDPLSITPFSSEISNANPYDQELTTDIFGQPIHITNNSLQFSGDNYIIMTAEPVEVYQSISAVKNPFAKIILCDSPGKILYNTYVSMTQIYENPISSLNELTINFYTPDGVAVNFDGLEHSFTLEIVTISDIPQGTRINANTGKNYNQSVSGIY